MKRKSVGGFVTGLIGTIGSLFLSYYIYVILSLVVGLAEEITTELMILQILCYLYFASVILGIVAVCFYFKKARLGGFLMLGATICNAAFPVYTVLMGGEMEIFAILMFLPIILLMISMFLGIFSKKVQVYQPENVARPQVEKYCHICGTTLKGTDEFCHKCGTRQ